MLDFVFDKLGNPDPNVGVVSGLAYLLGNVVGPALLGVTVVALGIGLGVAWVRRVRSAV